MLHVLLQFPPIVYVVPTSSPQQLMVANVTSNTTLLLWSPPPPEDHNGVITVFEVNITTVLTGETIQLFTNQTQLEVDFLKPHTDYSVVIAAHTQVGSGPFSTTLLFRTAEDGKLIGGNN